MIEKVKKKFEYFIESKLGIFLIFLIMNILYLIFLLNTNKDFTLYDFVGWVFFYSIYTLHRKVGELTQLQKSDKNYTSKFFENKLILLKTHIEDNIETIKNYTKSKSNNLSKDINILSGQLDAAGRLFDRKESKLNKKVITLEFEIKSLKKEISNLKKQLQ